MLETMNLSKFLTENVPPFILGAFFNRFLFSTDNKFVYTLISYDKSKRLSDSINDEFDNYFFDYLKILNHKYPNFIWITYNENCKNIGIRKPASKGTAYLFLNNDLNVSPDSFYNKLYSKIVNIDAIHTDDLNEYKKDFLRGFFELRGSIDTKLGFITQDYFYNSDFELQRIKLLYEFFNVPTATLNFNFRELQSQFISGENKRNTQLRIRMKWYLHNIGIISPYKNLLLSQYYNFQDKKTIDYITYYINESEEVNDNLISTFEERIKYFTKSIYNKPLNDAEINKIREEIGFDEKEKISLRDASLITVFRDNTSDECICCKQLYDIKDRSFINKKTNRFYFEIHHIISLGGNKELDDVNNLSKLCPTCHAALKKGRALETYQKELIQQIYQNNSNALDFAKHYFDTDDINEIIEQTYKNLK